MTVSANENSLQNSSVWESFDAFVAGRGKALWRSAWLLTRDRHKAEDLVQTALAKTFGKFDRLNREGAYEAYVRRTLYTTFVSWWRRKWNSETPTDLNEREPVATGVLSETESSQDIARALGQLSKMQRAVIVLRFYEDKTEAETAELLGISLGSVKTHARRALTALRKNPNLVGVEGGGTVEGRV